MITCLVFCQKCTVVRNLLFEFCYNLMLYNMSQFEFLSCHNSSFFFAISQQWPYRPIPHPPPSKIVQKSNSSSITFVLFRRGGGPALRKCTKVPVPVMMKLYTTPPCIITLVTWVPQKRQGKLHPSLRGCSGPPPFKWVPKVQRSP